MVGRPLSLPCKDRVPRCSTRPDPRRKRHSPQHRRRASAVAVCGPRSPQEHPGTPIAVFGHGFAFVYSTGERLAGVATRPLSTSGWISRSAWPRCWSGRSSPGGARPGTQRAVVAGRALGWIFTVQSACISLAAGRSGCPARQRPRRTCAHRTDRYAMRAGLARGRCCLGTTRPRLKPARLDSHDEYGDTPAGNSAPGLAGRRRTNSPTFACITRTCAWVTFSSHKVTGNRSPAMPQLPASQWLAVLHSLAGVRLRHQQAEHTECPGDEHEHAANPGCEALGPLLVSHLDLLHAGRPDMVRRGQPFKLAFHPVPRPGPRRCQRRTPRKGAPDGPLSSGSGLTSTSAVPMAAGPPLRARHADR